MDGHSIRPSELGLCLSEDGQWAPRLIIQAHDASAFRIFRLSLLLQYTSTKYCSRGAER